MLSKILFCLASCLFAVSLFEPAVQQIGGRALPGIETFYFTLRYGTAGLFGAGSVADFVTHLVALVSAAANFALVFWAMLTWAPTRITTLRWFWWISTLFIVAAAYTGLQVALSGRATLAAGYYYWFASLVLMLCAPVVARFEHKLRRRWMVFRGRMPVTRKQAASTPVQSAARKSCVEHSC